jgi:hypothetical protein
MSRDTEVQRAEERAVRAIRAMRMENIVEGEHIRALDGESLDGLLWVAEYWEQESEGPRTPRRSPVQL